MSQRSWSAIGAAGAVLAGALALGSTADATPGPVGATRTCYEQLDSDNGQGIVSQNVEPSFDDFDSQGADDFTLGTTCRLKSVTAVGTYYDGAGPIDSVNVTIYRSRHSGPGRVERQLVDATYTDVCGGIGCPMVTMKGRLGPGRHWLSVQVNMDFSSGGPWGWMTNNTVRGRGATWQNPGDGFATGCTTYGDLLTCLPNGEGGDFAFSLSTRTLEK